MLLGVLSRYAESISFLKITLTLSPAAPWPVAIFFLTAVRQIQHTKEGDIGREIDDSDDVTAAREGRPP